MYEIDRMVVIIKPTQDYVDWLNKQLEEEDAVSLDLLLEDCTCLLIPTFEDITDAEDYIRENHLLIFKNELEDWDLDLDESATLDDYEEFSRLFDVEYHSLVFDMLTGDMSGHQFSTNTLQ